MLILYIVLDKCILLFLDKNLPVKKIKTCNIIKPPEEVEFEFFMTGDDRTRRLLTLFEYERGIIATHSHT
jgi:hypothetical protein